MFRNKFTSLSITCLILCLISNPSPSSSSNDHSFQILDVSKSLQQTRNASSPSSTHHFNSALSLTLSSLPFNSNSNYTSLTLSRFTRDQARVRHLLHHHSLSLSKSKSKSRNPNFQSPVTSGFGQGTGEYLARIGVGRPVKQFYMAIDTGSDVSWLQCRPCFSCFQQSDPIFNPSASSTYKSLSCTSKQCAALDTSACFRDNCIYQVSYGDGSYTVGNFATETISFGSSGSVSGVAIGCGHDNEGLFTGSEGLLGLGGSSLSLPSQIKATSFSYCLVDRDSRSSSTLDFNSTAPADSVVAPMLSNSFIKTYLYVGLTGINVGGRAVRIPRGAFAIGRRGSGGVIVDSGTTVTRFPAAVYESLRDAFRDMTRNLRRAGGFSLLDTCYDLSSSRTVRVPTVSFKFSGGKTLTLPPDNYLMPVDESGKYCFAFAGTEGSLSIIGNTQQQGTRVTFNLAKKFIGFSPNKC
ncbi:protein ASPARTIC PROTEASE IN GUARD CELL 1-like [Salvia miltiorrhiza]|uniref:protein ASPARTIC PROTEASE IN GUARD CELL 1-like n=1 Tax=Salvia miltiorrhiza TaxID=226208 RepID=UPI0025AC53B5|nr:protein ASPARTIC PROTEASE IN GUARD CELL 1-like [Salvia miltiorrhiza]